MGKIGEKYSFKKKLDSQHEKKISTEPSVNEVMEAVIAGENDPSTHNPTGNATYEDDLMELLGQFSSLT